MSAAPSILRIVNGNDEERAEALRVLAGQELPPGPPSAVGPAPRVVTAREFGEFARATIAEIEGASWVDRLIEAAEPAPLAGGSLGPPNGWTVAAAAEPLPAGPSAAEVEAVRALPLDARRALCGCAGPGWAVHATGPAVPRLYPVDAKLVGGAVVAWLPAGICGVVDLVANRMGVGRRAAYVSVGAHVNDETPVRLAALRVLAAWWR